VSEELAKLGYDWSSEKDPEHTHLFDDLGLDSLDGFDMVVALEDRFEASGSEENFSRTFTVRAVIETACVILRSAGRLSE
jgi:acyl carrier protein